MKSLLTCLLHKGITLQLYQQWKRGQLNLEGKKGRLKITQRLVVLRLPPLLEDRRLAINRTANARELRICCAMNLARRKFLLRSKSHQADHVKGKSDSSSDTFSWFS